MFIGEYMTSSPITVPSGILIPEARKLMNEYGIRHLPVVDAARRLIGIVTDRDLRSAYPSSVLTKDQRQLAFDQVEKTEVAEIMTTSCTTLGPEASLDDALLIFDRDKVGGIPVVSEEGVVLGIFSLLDLTAAYRKLFGIGEEGSILLGVEDDGRENILCEITSLLEKQGIPVTRLIRLEEMSEDDGRIYMRINTPRPVEVVKLLKASGFTITES